MRKNSGYRVNDDSVCRLMTSTTTSVTDGKRSNFVFWTNKSRKKEENFFRLSCVADGFNLLRYLKTIVLKISWKQRRYINELHPLPRRCGGLLKPLCFQQKTLAKSSLVARLDTLADSLKAFNSPHKMEQPNA